MKKVIILAAIAALCCSCGTTRSTAVNEYEQEVHDIGYSKVLGDSKTTASSKLKVGKSKATVTYANMYDYLRGRVPGVNIGPNGDITIRGEGSNNHTNPLILVDNVEITDLSTIDPSMVDSVEVIKDGSTSIYGMRGATGVILISMKK